MNNSNCVTGRHPIYPHVIHVYFNGKGYNYNQKSDEVFVCTFSRMGSGTKLLKSGKQRKAVIEIVKEYLENNK